MKEVGHSLARTALKKLQAVQQMVFSKTTENLMRKSRSTCVNGHNEPPTAKLKSRSASRQLKHRYLQTFTP